MLHKLEGGSVLRFSAIVSTLADDSDAREESISETSEDSKI